MVLAQHFLEATQPRRRGSDRRAAWNERRSCNACRAQSTTNMAQGMAVSVCLPPIASHAQLPMTTASAADVIMLSSMKQNKRGAGGGGYVNGRWPSMTTPKMLCLNDLQERNVESRTLSRHLCRSHRLLGERYRLHRRHPTIYSRFLRRRETLTIA